MAEKEVKLETKRLILRNIRKSDLKDLVNALNDIKVSKHLSLVSFPYRKKDALEWIKICQKKQKGKKRADYNFAIILKSKNKLIGGTSLSGVNKFQGTAKTGSWIGRKYWRRGIIKEAKIAVYDFAFDKLKLRKLETEAHVKNKASNSMMKKLGHRYEGKRIKSVRSKATGKIHDINLYGLFKKDYKKIRPKLIKELRGVQKRAK